MTQAERIIHIHAAAWYFANISRDVDEIAAAFGRSRQTIRNWANTPAWADAIRAYRYRGSKTFGNVHISNGDPVFDAAREAYQDAIRSGQPKKTWVSKAARACGKHPNVVRRWAEKYGWQ